MALRTTKVSRPDSTPAVEPPAVEVPVSEVIPPADVPLSVGSENIPVIEEETNEEVPATEEPKVEEKPVEPKPETKKEKPVEQTAAVPAVSKSALPAIVGEGCAPSLASLKNVIDPAEFEGVFPRITGKGSGLICDKLVLGEFIDMQVMSHSERTFVTPGNDNSLEELSFLCRASYDHKTVVKDRESGDVMTIEDYIDWMVEECSEKYPKIEPKKALYHDVFGVIFGADKNLDKAILLNMVQMSVSTTAVKFWKQFVAQAPIAVRRGQMLASHQNCVRITGTADTSKGGKSFIAVRFEAVPLDVLAGYEIIVE